jgi:hypothetical protein
MSPTFMRGVPCGFTRMGKPPNTDLNETSGSRLSIACSRSGSNRSKPLLRSSQRRPERR